ncbi:ChuX/HutX family heme-like substrate-binding protein [Aquabacterium sp.]|uniref:hemin-degrading factor n=1 Tax=Aquabacterium sp. TaxID=1872578 RepID=UPI00248892FD|nr:ChuX/HutX family heme-like substrate-binding protein [Aquabacterium sp.]MDI1259862.1 hemin-degrading factor [Aquabacterium sp.]
MITDTSHLTLLREQFAALRAQGLRARDAARQLDLSEGDVMAAHAASQMHPDVAEHSLYTTMPLDSDWVNLLQGLENCGPVMALTRNESVVHEKVGVYRNVTATGLMGLALGPEIDLRLFLSKWHAGFHVIEHTAKGEQHSLQFFDAHGRAVHKVHARPRTDLNALEALVQRHARPEARPVFMPGSPMRATIRPDEAIDALGLGDAWAAMTDTHQLFSLLRQFEVDRAQSFRLMEGIHTRRIPLLSVQWLLEAAASSGLPIMVFAGNEGCLQIHTGAVHRIELMGPWLNVLDDGFNLHLRHDHIAESWLVTKPTEDGPVTSVELFDEQGQLIAMFFGERKPGKAELPAWRALAHRLVRGPVVQAEPA